MARWMIFRKDLKLILSYYIPENRALETNGAHEETMKRKEKNRSTSQGRNSKESGNSWKELSSLNAE